jgi:hypothetical protein
MLLRKTFIALASLMTIIIYDRHIFIVQATGFVPGLLWASQVIESQVGA